jgi:hypothetical protein
MDDDTDRISMNYDLTNIKRDTTHAQRTPSQQPSCMMVAAIVMGASAFPPALTVIGIISEYIEGEAINNLAVPLAFYGGDVVLSVVLAWGLWYLKNWARIIVIILLSVAIFAGFVLGGLLAGIILLLIFGYIIYWFASNGKFFN